MSDAHLVTMIALALTGLSFLLYAVEVIVALRAKPMDDAHQAVQKAAALMPTAPLPTLSDLSKLLDSITKLTDSLSKAGPALTSLIAAVLFLAIAAASSGAFRGSKDDAPPAHQGAADTQPAQQRLPAKKT